MFTVEMLLKLMMFALLSDDIHCLQRLLQLAMEYAEEYHIDMVPEKTKLLCYTPHGQHLDKYYWKVVSQWRA